SGIESGLPLASTETLLQEWPLPPFAQCWLPDPDALQEPSVEASWRVTSDSLSVWLAQRLGAKALLLVKSIPLSDSSRSVDSLIDDGVIDPAMPDFLAKSALKIWISGPNDHDHLSEKLARPNHHFCRVEG
ncbi:MAG: hypothetical protein EBY15_10980, partial [Gammaproteobacteria bacterium]|nr:hypothetical protein [Gammaproteobacteria bacterium]